MNMESDCSRWQIQNSDAPILQTKTQPCPHCAGCIARTVSSPNQHLLRAEDVVSCCLDLSVPSISFRINGQPVQGMFENFNSDGLFFPVASFSAGVKSVLYCKQFTPNGNLVFVCPPSNCKFFMKVVNDLQNRDSLSP